MEPQRTIDHIVAAYQPEVSEAERIALAAQLAALAAGLFEGFRASLRFDESPCGMVDSELPHSGL